MKELWKLEGDLCRCCHAEGVFDSLSTPRQLNGVTEIYSNMLEACFNIVIFAVPSSMNDVTFNICESCIIRLRDAYNFKKLVQECEEKFTEYYNSQVTKGKVINNECDVRKKENNIIDNDVVLDFDIGDNNHDFRDLDKEDLTTSPPPTPQKNTKRKGSEQLKKGKKIKPKKKVTKITQESAVKDADGRSATKFQLRNEDYKHDGDSFRCGHCNKRLKMASVRTHVRNHHYKIPNYSCEQCDAQFVTLAPFTAHKLEVHNIDERFKCKACRGAFNTHIQLRKHIKNFHMLGEKYKCEFCDYESFSVEGVYKHKFKHKTVKDYHCRFCKKSFLRKTNLDLHERIHTGDKRKVCKECGQAFVQKSSLNYHMTKYHPSVIF